MALVGAGVSALVVVGLLTGACSGSHPRGNCWRPGICYYTDSDGEPLYACPQGERFEVAQCPTTLRVGACVTPHRTVYLYAPLHGILPPDCEAIAGPGATYSH